MPSKQKFAAVVVGSGPNGLAAAITLAQAGRTVQVLEARDTVGGGMRSAELTLPGYVHDICSTIHSLGRTSPFLRTLPLGDFGLEWVFPQASLAHPLDGGRAVVIEHNAADPLQGVKATAATLGRDGPAYYRFMAPIVGQWLSLAVDLLGPTPVPPRHPILFSQFGLRALWPAATLIKLLFKGERARAVMGGMAAHSMLPLEAWLTSAFAVVLNGGAHAVGWPVARGGSQALADALAAYLRSLGGEIVTGCEVQTMDDLPAAQAVMFDLTPRQLARIAERSDVPRLPEGYLRQMKKFRYGPGVFKVDWALDAPIPWQAVECARCATVHVGGTLDELADSERAPAAGVHVERPFVLLTQATLFDKTRAPEGKHTAWAYCHVPNGSTENMADRIEAQVERFAPGFRSRILGRHLMSATQMEAYNPNYVGGDINGGVQDFAQHFGRPVFSLTPYRTPAKGLYLCSSSTPPGGGTHGMSGYHAARTALRDGVFS